MAITSLRPANKIIVDQRGRLDLEWDAYLARLESRLTQLEAGSAGVPGTRLLTAGAGLTGGGDLSADRTFDVGAGTGITVNANDVALDAASTLNTDHAGVTLTAGAGLTGGGTIAASRTFDVGAGSGITVNANDVALDTTSNRNVDHSGVTLTAGAGLTGGGDITASRTFDIGAGTAITVNANDVAVTAGGIGTTQLADNGVTMAKLEDAGAYTILLRNNGASGDPAYAKISSLTNSSGFGAGDKIMIEESSGELRKIDYSDLPGGGSTNIWTSVKKVTDENRASNTTLTNDSELLFAMAANTNYVFRGEAFYDTPASADFKYDFQGPAGSSLVRIQHYGIDPDGSFANTGTDEAYGISTPQTSGASTFGWFQYSGIIRNGATSGNFVVQWAQNSSVASNTTVRAGSYIEYSLA